MRKLQTPIAIIILVVLIVSYIPPPESQAISEDQIRSGISCTIGASLAPWLQDLAFRGLRWLYVRLSPGIRDFLGWGVVNFFFPPDVPVNQARINSKEFIGDVLGRCGALVILDTISQRTTAAIRTSGRDGGPAFVRNWRNFKLDAQRRGENIFRSILGSTTLCPYFSGDIRTLFKANNQPPADRISSRVDNLDSFQQRGNCTMPQGWSIQNYQRDFSGNGGWDALTKLSQPQNNFYGNLLMSLSELSIQRAAEEDSDMSSVIAGLGFDSRRGKNRQDSCLLRVSNNDCIVYKDILTPGSYLQGSAEALVAQELAWITSIDELNELIGNLTGRLLKKILDLSGTRPESAVIDGSPPPERPPSIDDDPGGPLPPPPEQTECSDRIDNDLDGLIDWPADPECTDSLDNSEGDDGLPGTRFITSISPLFGPAGITVTLNGRNLDATVQMHTDDASRTRFTFLGTVNADRTQVTFVVPPPADIPLGNYTVRVGPCIEPCTDFSNEVRFTITDGSPLPPVACRPPSQIIFRGGTATLSATGGDGRYSWSATSGSPSSGRGTTFTVQYETVGSHMVTVTSLGLSDSCIVDAIIPSP